LNRIIKIVAIWVLIFSTIGNFGCARKEKTPYQQIEARLRGKSQSQRIEYLIEIFEEKNDQPILDATIRLLAKEKEAAISPLIEQLRQQKGEREEYAMLALELIGKPAVDSLIDLFNDKSLKKDAQAILIVMGKDTLKSLASRLKISQKKEEKIALIETITFLGVSDEEMIRLMLEIFSDEKEDEEVRVKALTCLLLSIKDSKETIKKISEKDKGTLGEAASLILKEIEEEQL
jgi:hypothetical protein